ncbi:MAG: ASKHA domain-containing protein, partial [Syntrophorhabdales bacterium]
IKIMLDQMAVDKNDLAEVLLAGAFGNYIDKANARSIGLLPDIPLDLIKPIGNAAGAGAKAALLSREVRSETETIVRRVKVINLAYRSDFQRRFLESMSLKEA